MIFGIAHEKEPIVKKGEPMIIISNHVSYLDPIIFLGILTFREMLAIIPIRPMIGRGYYYSPLLPFAYLAGCYPAKPLAPYLKRYSGTTAALRYARDGCSLGIYPEGQRSRNEAVKPKYGVIKIIKNVKKPQLYFVHIKKSKTKKRYLLTMKRNDDLVSATDPQELMDYIFNLSLPTD